MAGHSQFANIKHRKGAQDAKKAKLFTKIIREITVSAKSGQPDPEFNPRLRNAIIEARNNNMPKDRVDTAIKKVIAGGEGENFEEIRYEGYASGGVAIIVEALTDNRNRTASEVRSIFTKMGGALGETGSVGFMFDKVGIIQFETKVASNEKIFESAIEAGADDVEINDDFYLIVTKPENFIVVRDILTKQFGDATSAKLDWKAKNLIEISDIDQAQKILKMIDLLEDCDDVQNVTGNYIFHQEIIDKI
ncbi:MAG: YebC/PmpR family DNA-binding transcriptional regulator [Proteobacteria bacterium]|nr:YebC/PmpR family DNA-binding transcriptional regulator [Pseudomonadota bacterium]NCA28732.1 YebC/PmpR family DNA-binding transcriptional regulator [Pseudomonadota bacterium]